MTTTERPRIAPGPPNGLVRTLFEYRRDPLGLFLRSAREYGGLVRFRMGPVQVFLVTGPSQVRHVLIENAQNYAKGASYESLSLVLGKGLLCAEGDLWRRQRRLMNPAFKKKSLTTLLPAMAEVVNGMLQRWRGTADAGSDLCVMEEMLTIGLEIVIRTLFGTTIGEEDMALVKAAVPIGEAVVYDKLESVFKIPMAVPTPQNVRLNRVKRTLVDVVSRTIERFREEPSGEETVLARLLAARDEETGEGMSHQQLIDECLTLMLGGHETSALSMAWTSYLISQHPEVEARMHAELDSVLGDGVPTAEQLGQLEYTGRVIEESLRLYPTAWSFTRRPLEDDAIDGYRIPKGAMVVVSPYVIHRREEVWPEPERFDPDRFLPERSRGRALTEYCPFGVGQHTCIGKGYALQEIRLVLAMVGRAYRLRLFPGHPVEPLPQMTLKARHGIRMTLEPRGGS